VQEAVLVHVFVIDLQDVVVDVHDRERDVDALRPERLELEGGHGAGGVLDQDLADYEVARHQVLASSFRVRLCGSVMLFPLCTRAGTTLLVSGDALIEPSYA